ncbi:MAG: 6-phospho-beta-glucosidase [Lachnospiraceae bacterium]|nr:6-phospho-beta-glucosidase [Lachnospiraceae bacterium]
MRLTIIGAGSVYTPEIFDGLIARWSRLRFDEIYLVDIEQGMSHARIIEAFARRMFEAAGIPVKIVLTEDRREALKNTDFVISQIRVGGWQARALDEQSGMELGLIGQETTGVGGFMNAMRTIPVVLEIARDMEALCPNAWLVNFTNPSGLVTEAVLKKTNVKCIGLCNVPGNMQADAEKALGVTGGSLKCRFAGLNHLSFMVNAQLDGQDVLPQLVKLLGEHETLMKNIPKVAGTGELIQALEVIPSPYLQYYYFENEMREKQLHEWETECRSRAVTVHEIDEMLFEKYTDVSLKKKPDELSQRGGSLYSYAALNVIQALTEENPWEMTVNISNEGAIPDLKDSDVVEMNCLISRAGIQRIAYDPLVSQVAGLVQMVKQYERMTVEAAVSRDRKQAVQALLNHPLIHGYRNAEAVVIMLEQRFPEYIYWEKNEYGYF